MSWNLNRKYTTTLLSLYVFEPDTVILGFSMSRCPLQAAQHDRIENANAENALEVIVLLDLYYEQFELASQQQTWLVYNWYEFSRIEDS